MAQLLAHPAPPHRDDPVLRYGFDRHALTRWFGGAAQISRLCAVYGLPDPCRNRLGGQLQVTTSSLAILLELGERMHKPIDLYQFLRESR